MGLDMKYFFIHNEQRSKGYSVLRTCVNVGAAEIKKPWDVQYRTSVVGQNIGMPRSFDGAKDRARELLRKQPVGETIVMQRLDNKGEPSDQVRFRKATVKPPVADTPGVIGIDRIVGWVNTEARAGRLQDVRYAGICVCKPDSDHRDCAAVDIFATWDSMHKIENEFWSKPDWYNCKYSILGDTIRFLGHSENYTGVYHTHNHLSVNGGIPGSAC